MIAGSVVGEDGSLFGPSVRLSLPADGALIEFEGGGAVHLLGIEAEAFSRLLESQVSLV